MIAPSGRRIRAAGYGGASPLRALWFGLWAVLAALFLVVLVSNAVTPDPTDTDPSATAVGLGVLTVLCGIIATQAAFGLRGARRSRLAGPGRGPADRLDGIDLAALTDASRRIADAEAILSGAVLDLGAAVVVDAAVRSSVEEAARVGKRAAGTLRALADQSLAVGRAAAGTMPPDRDRLVAAAAALRRRLDSGLRDYERLARSAAQAAVDGAPGAVVAASDQVAAMVHDLGE
jgi:hypothetical protein